MMFFRAKSCEVGLPECGVFGYFRGQTPGTGLLVSLWVSLTFCSAWRSLFLASSRCWTVELEPMSWSGCKNRSGGIADRQGSLVLSDDRPFRKFR